MLCDLQLRSGHTFLLTLLELLIGMNIRSPTKDSGYAFLLEVYGQSDNPIERYQIILNFSNLFPHLELKIFYCSHFPTKLFPFIVTLLIVVNVIGNFTSSVTRKWPNFATEQNFDRLIFFVFVKKGFSTFVVGHFTS